MSQRSRDIIFFLGLFGVGLGILFYAQAYYNQKDKDELSKNRIASKLNHLEEYAKTNADSNGVINIPNDGIDIDITVDSNECIYFDCDNNDFNSIQISIAEPNDPNAVWLNKWHVTDSNGNQYWRIDSEYLDELYRDDPKLAELAKELYGIAEPVLLKRLVQQWENDHPNKIQIETPNGPNEPFYHYHNQTIKMRDVYSANPKKKI